MKGKKFKIQGSGTETRSFIYIDDFVQAFYQILKKGKHLEIYNIEQRKSYYKKIGIKLSKILKKK